MAGGVRSRDAKTTSLGCHSLSRGYVVPEPVGYQRQKVSWFRKRLVAPAAVPSASTSTGTVPDRGACPGGALDVVPVRTQSGHVTSRTNGSP